MRSLRLRLGHLSLTLGLSTSVLACGDSEPTPPDGGAPDAAGPRPDGGPGPIPGPFEAYREIRTAIRTSPDHLIARAEALVAAKDAPGLLALVRDQVATYPPQADRLDDMVGAMRWGPRVALRGGAGTPREKAELLVSLYEQAGFEAEVVEGTLQSSISPASLFLRPQTAELDFHTTPAQEERWQAALGRTIERGTPPALYEGERAETEALAAALAARLPGAAAPFDFNMGPVPLVRVVVGGETQFANPLVPDATFGESYTEEAPVPAGPAGELQRIAVRLEGAKVEAPFSPIVFVEREWTADEVAGRRIFAGFMPILSKVGFSVTKTDDVDVVVPTLSVQSFDLEKPDLAALSALGKPISRGGSVFELHADDTLSIDGVSIGRGPTDPEDLARVAEAQSSANPVLFPRVRLQVRADDGSGVSVPRLMSDAFTLREGGVDRGFIMRRNLREAPRVLMLFDNSDSIPAEFRDAARVGLGTDLATRIFALDPNAEIRVATVDFGISFQGPWVQSTTEVEDQLALIAGTGSDLWLALEGAMEAEPTVVVLVTDGVASDALDRERRIRIAGRAPVVVLAVGAIDDAAVQRITDLSAGQSFLPMDASAAVDSVMDYLAARQSVHYELEYTSLASRGSTVSVELSVGSATSTTSFVAPRDATPAARFSGLWITITTGGQSVRRKIAGYDGPFVTPPPPIDDTVLTEVEGALLSSIEIRVEGAPPPTSVWLDEWLTHLLEKEPMFTAFEEDDGAAFLKTLGERTLQMDPSLLQLLGRTDGRASEDHLTFETGLQISSITRRPVLGDGIEITSDVFPRSRWSTAATSPTAAHRATLAHTTRLMRIEAARRMQSVASLLDGVPLVSVRPAEIDTDLAALSPEQRELWRRYLAQFGGGEYVALVPEAGAPPVFWLVHQGGTVIGVDGESSAGWASSYEADRQAINLVFGAAGMYLDPELGVWAELERLKLIFLSYATQILDNGMLSASEMLQEIGCSAFSNSGILDPIPGGGFFFGGAQVIIGSIELADSLLDGPPNIPESPVPCF